MSDDVDDVDALLVEQGAALADAMLAALPGWAGRAVAAFRPELQADGEASGRAAATALEEPLRRLLSADVDAQRANPLAIARQAVGWPTAVLRDAGVTPVERDEHERAHFPDDDYALTPMSFAELGPHVQDAGIVWGAVKARAHMLRHKR